jgi:adenosylmethionine-8-amino-7-oxononanoate aminotransferase
MRSLASRDELVVWHPFTQSGMKQPELLEVKSASGAQIRLTDGRSLIDGISSWWCNAHGHCHPKLVEALTQQARVLDHVLFAECALFHAPLLHH